MTSCFVARISNPGERFGKPFYEVDVPSPLSVQEFIPAFFAFVVISRRQLVRIPIENGTAVPSVCLPKLRDDDGHGTSTILPVSVPCF